MIRLVQDTLLRQADTSKDAVVDERGSATYAQLLDDALRFARLLQDSGVERGDRVALYLDNTRACASSIFGTLLAGGVFTVVNPQTKADKLAYILEDSETRVLVAEEHSAATALDAAGRVQTLRRTLTTDQLGDALAASSPDPAAPKTIPLDLATLVYTSGTTGRPKGVMLSHGALTFGVASIADYLRLGGDDRILSILPMAFTYGLGQLLLTTYLGATLLLERSFAFPARTLQRIAREEATVFPAVPTVYVTIVGLVENEAYPGVRCLTNAAAGLPPALHEGIARVFPNAALFRMYGQTECQRVCYLEPELIERKPTSVGRAIPGTETLVLGDDGTPVAPGEVGVLHVRGPHIMLGYWREPELTAQALRDGPLPGERMLCTRDYFTVDEDGDLYFVDRSDDVIKTRGEKVSSVEVENVLHELDGIAQAAVIGVPDELLGAAIRAYVVLDGTVALDATSVIAQCRARLENFMVPRDVVVVDELPHTDSGKVRKQSLSREPVVHHDPSALRLGGIAAVGAAEKRSD